MDHELHCVLRNPSAEAIHKFESRMSMSQGACWTVSMAETLLSSIQKRPNLLYLLARADIDDHVLYAVQQYLPDVTNQVLEQEQGYSVAIVAVVRMWEALERMRSFSSTLAVDTLWIYSHVEPDKLNAMAHIAVDIITRYVQSRIMNQSSGFQVMSRRQQYSQSSFIHTTVALVTLLLPRMDCLQWIQILFVMQVSRFFRSCCNTT